MNRVYGMVMCTAFLGAILSQVFIPFPDVNIYFLECGLLTAWLVADAFERKAPIRTTILWTALALVLAPIVIPRWYANRPLKTDEWRKGGTDTNFYNAFGLVTVMFTGVSAACSFLSFGANHGFELIINAGFSVAGTAFVLALATKQEAVFEKGKATALPKSADAEID